MLVRFGVAWSLLLGVAAAQHLPTGQMITPLAAPGAVFMPLRTDIGPFPDYVADGAAAMALSPDGRQLLLLTSGYNRYNDAKGAISLAQSQQYVFRYTINAKGAFLSQTLPVPNSFSGLAWAPDGRSFYVGGGLDDVVYDFVRRADGFAAGRAPIKLGHGSGAGLDVQPQAAGVAVSPDGTRLLVANYYNDSVSLIDLVARAVVAEQDLRPGKVDLSQSGVPGGEYPVHVVWRDNHHAYVSAARDREIVVLNVEGKAITIAKRIATIGEPTALLFDKARARLYATEDNADRLAIVNAAADVLVTEPQVGLPDGLRQISPESGGWGKGINPNALFLAPDGHLLVTFGGINALAVLEPRDTATRVIGLIPTGWYPSAVAADASGRRLFVANRKSPPGPNPKGCAPKLAVTKAQPNACGAANQYIFQLEKGGLLSLPMPSPHVLMTMTRQVAANIGLPLRKQRAVADQQMAEIRSKIRHVIYIVKENRTYDQVLGDLEVGNGDPRLAILGKPFSPNHHQLARQFVTLDNFYDSGEQSSTGWTWSTAARTTDLLEKTAPVNYARRGLAYDAEEADRNIPAQLSLAERRTNNVKVPADPDILPGPALATAPDAEDDTRRGQGFIWNQAIRAGLSVRNYGVADASVYDDANPSFVPLVRDPFAVRRVIYTSGDRDLATRSDPYFRGFDQKMPDYWRALEWQREFDQQVASDSVPALTIMRLSHDHFGDFDKGIDGVNTVETQMADNDFALGMIIERVSKSPRAGDTVLLVVEDDAQNGADHVDARRSIAFVVGAYVKQRAIISTRYTTVNILRTIEALLGLKPMGLNDALALPMSDVFDPHGDGRWSYSAHAADVLRATKLPITADRFELQKMGALPCPPRSAAYWSRAMKGQDFSAEDRLDTARFNAALWAGMKRDDGACDR
jgi:DNA-binding beta-propeller fold protein YncE